MKRKMFLIVALTIFSLSTVLGQLKVINNFGQDLWITVSSQKILVPYKSAKTFSARSSRTIWLECATLDSKIKFSVSKEVPRSEYVTIESSDNNVSVQTQTQNTSTVSSVASGQISTGSLSNILGSVNVSNTSGTANTNSVAAGPRVLTNQVVTTKSYIDYGNIALVYTGDDKFKIFSELGRGLEFSGKDTTDLANNVVRNRYVLSLPKNQDVVIGVGIVNNKNQAIYRYAEIRKRTNSSDTICSITKKDLKIMSTIADDRKLRIRLTAENYKIFFESDDSTPISIGFREFSRSIRVPIGQFYLRVSFTDPAGMFHRTVFVPKHVTAGDRNLEITKFDLDNAIQLDW